jgi:hypothetical protein
MLDSKDDGEQLEGDHGLSSIHPSP